MALLGHRTLYPSLNGYQGNLKFVDIPMKRICTKNLISTGPHKSYNHIGNPDKIICNLNDQF